MQQNSLDTLKVCNKDVRIQERLIQVPGSYFEGQNGFFQDCFKTRILQTVVNGVTKSHHQIIVHGSDNDFLLCYNDISPLKGAQALLSNTADTPSMSANVALFISKGRSWVRIVFIQNNFHESSLAPLLSAKIT